MADLEGVSHDLERGGNKSHEHSKKQCSREERTVVFVREVQRSD